MKGTLSSFVLIVLSCLSLVASAQHPGHTHAPYAGEQARQIKALSEDEVKSLLDGAGMGYAKSAELNRYPGPMHVLENADELKLSGEQRHALQSLMKRHKDEVRGLGADLVRLEQDLDRLFTERVASEATVDAKLAEIATAQAKVRGSHLKTHLATTALLTAGQIETYVRLRGYASGS